MVQVILVVYVHAWWCRYIRIKVLNKNLFYVFFLFHSASDATQIFEETKHSVEAREMMQAFFVGIFVEVSSTTLLRLPVIIIIIFYKMKHLHVVDALPVWYM